LSDDPFQYVEPTLTPKQQKVWDIVKNAPFDRTTIIGYGGALGGGEMEMIAFLALRLAIDFPGNLILVARKDFTDLHDTTMKLFDEICPPPYLSGPYGKVGRNDQWNWRRLRLASWPPNVYSEIRFRGLHDITSVGSSEYGAILLDEASEIDRDVVMYTLARLRHTPPLTVRTHPNYRGIKRIFFAASNPFPGWYRDWFHLRKLDEDLLRKIGAGGVHFVQALASDNPHLPPTYVQEQIALHSGDSDFIRRMLEGRWDAFEGQVYKNFNPLIHEWLYREPAEGEYGRVIGGVDFGMEMAGAHNTAGIVGLVLNSGRLLRVAEFAENGPKVHERLLTWMLAQQARWCNKKTNSKIQWVGDRSQSVGLSTWQTMGFNIRESKGGRDSVEAGIQAVSARLERDAAGMPGSFYLPELTGFKEEMESYHRDDNGKVVKLLNDLVDADRYQHELLEVFLGDPAQLGLGKTLARVA